MEKCFYNLNQLLKCRSLKKLSVQDINLFITRRNNMSQIKTIYISEEDEKTYEKVIQEAVKTKRGIGFILMEAWRKVSEVKK